MSNPFKGEDPAASGDPQQNVEGASVTSGHHVSRALADLVDHGESTQRFYHLIHDLLLPKGRAESVHSVIQKCKITGLMWNLFPATTVLTQWACSSWPRFSWPEAKRKVNTLPGISNFLHQFSFQLKDHGRVTRRWLFLKKWHKKKEQRIESIKLLHTMILNSKPCGALATFSFVEESWGSRCNLWNLNFYFLRNIETWQKWFTTGGAPSEPQIASGSFQTSSVWEQ